MKPSGAVVVRGRDEDTEMKRKRVQTSTHNYAARAVVVVASTVCATPYKLFMSSLHIFPRRKWRNVSRCLCTLFPSRYRNVHRVISTLNERTRMLINFGFYPGQNFKIYLFRCDTT